VPIAFILNLDYFKKINTLLNGLYYLHTTVMQLTTGMAHPVFRVSSS